MTPEGYVKKEIDKRLKELYPNAWIFKPVQRGMGMPALDYLICHEGRFYAIEAKPLGKIPTPRQLLTRQQIIDAGGTVHIVIGLENAKKVIL